MDCVPFSYRTVAAVRNFVDSSGTEWDVWEVRPAYLDRRSAADRRSDARATPERRVRPGPKALLGDIADDGWLCFEHEGARRRFAPIPASWEVMPEPDLAKLCADAVPVPPPSTARRS
jgi:hypothetical protein